MTHVRDLFAPRAWHTLVPDQRHSLLTKGYEAGATYAAAARAADGSFALIYVPTRRSIVVDLRRLAGPVRARWYDPTDGTYTTSSPLPLPNTAEHAFVSPGLNSVGDDDWVLALETDPGSATAASGA